MKLIYFVSTILFIMVTGSFIRITVQQETNSIINKIDNTMSKAIESTLNTKQPVLLTDYEIQVISQDSLLIYNGSNVSQIHFNDIQKYIIKDNE